MFTSKFNKMYRHVIAQMNDDIMTKLGYGKQVEAKNNGICPQCNAKVDPTSFRDEVSAREFKISGLCQACQDEIFGTEEYETEEEPMTDLNEADCKIDEEDLPDDLNAYLHAEDPEDYRNDDYVNGDAQDFQDEEAGEETQEESQEESEIATDEDIEATKDLQDQDEDLEDFQDEDDLQDDDLQDQDEDLCDLEDEDLQDDDLEDSQDDEFEDDQDEDIKDTDQDFEEEFQDQDLQDEDTADVIAESKKKATKKSSKK